MPESVWDYPRPPRLERSSRHVRVVFGGAVIAETERAHRVLETSHPPGFYIPLADIEPGALVPVARRQTFCEFKGMAGYYDVVGSDGSIAEAAAWTYPDPSPGFEPIRDAISFYPGRVDECSVDGEVVRAQEGGFYGGWITDDVVGPFKGPPGTRGW